jgi:uncharacterized protein YggE
VIVSAGVVTQGATAAAAMAENAQRMAATVSSIRKAGVADRDIQTSSLSLNPQYRYADNQPPVITGYQASNQLSVRFHDVRWVGGVLDALVAAGANQINGPVFDVEKKDAALDEARASALSGARARADLYAKAAGMRVKRIISIQETSASLPSRPAIGVMAMARDAKMETSIEPGMEKLNVSVLVKFELE